MGEMLDILSDQTGELVSRMMELSSQRQKVISQNIANANTPGYKERTVGFEKKLSEVLEGDWTKSKIESIDIVTHKNTQTPGRVDGNNVDISEELNELMQNTLKHRLLARAKSTRGDILKRAAKGPQ